MLDVERISEQEAQALERALKLLRKEVASGNWKGTYGDLLAALRKEAYEQERFGARHMAGVLDAAHNVIMLFLQERQDRQHFRSRNK